MDVQQIDQLSSHISEKTKDALRESELRSFIEYLKSAVNGDRGEAFYLSGEISHDVYAAVLGLNSLRGKKVSKQHLYNTATRYETKLTSGFTISVDISPEVMLQTIADKQSLWADDPNDYIAGLVVELDDATSVAFTIESSEFNNGDCEFRRWVIVCAPDSVTRIDWDRGELY